MGPLARDDVGEPGLQGNILHQHPLGVQGQDRSDGVSTECAGVRAPSKKHRPCGVRGVGHRTQGLRFWLEDLEWRLHRFSVGVKLGV